MSLLMWAPIDRVVNKVPSNAAVVEQRIAFGRSPITDDLLPGLPSQKSERTEFSALRSSTCRPNDR